MNYKQGSLAEDRLKYAKKEPMTTQGWHTGMAAGPVTVSSL